MKKASVAKKASISHNKSMEPPNIIRAAEKNDVKAIHIALKLGVDINVQESRTLITPLHAAVAWGHVEATSALCEYDDLDLDIRDAQGRTAIDVALSLPYERIIGVLQRKAIMQLSDPDDRPFPEV